MRETPALTNHLGTLHAGALFTLADAASGAAIVGLYASELGRTRMVVSKSEVTFSRPARGTLTAVATAEEERSAVDERLSRDGRAELLVDVRICDDSGLEVARVHICWHLKQSSN